MTTYYIDINNGSDSLNSGLTEDAPLKTLKYAIGSKVLDGDVVILKQGTYSLDTTNVIAKLNSTSLTIKGESNRKKATISTNGINVMLTKNLYFENIIMIDVKNWNTASDSNLMISYKNFEAHGFKGSLEQAMFWTNSQNIFDNVLIKDFQYPDISFGFAKYNGENDINRNIRLINVKDVSSNGAIINMEKCIIDSSSNLKYGIDRMKGDFIRLADDSILNQNGYGYFDGNYVNKTLILNDGEYKKWNTTYSEKLVRVSKHDFTTNTNPNGDIVSASTMLNGRPPFNAFDGKYGVVDSWIPASGALTGWLAYSFANPIAVSKYVLKYPTESGFESRLPKNWTFEGSNDNNWVILDTQVNQVFNVRGDKEYTIPNTTSYKNYRLNITQNNGDTTYLMVVELELYGLERVPISSQFEVVSNELPTSQQFQSDGMDSLSPLLDRKLTTLEPMQMQSKSDILPVGSEGKVFSRIVDLKKYLDIRSMKVEVK